MPKLYRRSWEKQAQGLSGIISDPLPSRTGADGAISGASLEVPAGHGTPVRVFNSATANFTEADVGRLIRLEGTPGTGRYDWTYIIDSINSSTSVNLRLNHLLPDTPTSWARFFENGTGIAWTIHASATFSVPVESGQLKYWFAGSYLTIENSGLGAHLNRGQWRITHRIDDQSCIISKSHLFWPVDVGARSPNMYYQDHYWPFEAEGGLPWFISDRESYNPSDQWVQNVQAYMDMGWTLFQQRGSSDSTADFLIDWVLFSAGEPDPAVEGGKSMYLRTLMPFWYITNAYDTDFALAHMWAVFTHWDPTLTRGGFLVGDAGAGVRISANSMAHDPGNYYFAEYGDWSFTGLSDLYTPGRDGLPHEMLRMDWWAFGDADEAIVACNRSGVSGNTYWYSVISSLRPLKSINPNVMSLKAPVNAGSNVALSVGASNPFDLGYAIGDNITVVGYRSGSAKEFVETATITNIDVSNPADCKIYVNTLTKPFGYGPGPLLGHVGEDPYPICVTAVTGTANPAFRLHNSSRLNNATGRDYNNTNYYIAATWTGTGPTQATINPNRKTGRFGIFGIRIEYGSSEVRGTLRHFWRTPSQLTLGTKFVTPANEVFCNILNYGTGDAWSVGPMSKEMAGVV